jgi:hypothetical protein
MVTPGTVARTILLAVALAASSAMRLAFADSFLGVNDAGATTPGSSTSTSSNAQLTAPGIVARAAGRALPIIIHEEERVSVMIYRTTVPKLFLSFDRSLISGSDNDGRE